MTYILGSSLTPGTIDLGERRSEPAMSHFRCGSSIEQHPVRMLGVRRNGVRQRVKLLEQLRSLRVFGQNACSRVGRT